MIPRSYKGWNCITNAVYGIAVIYNFFNCMYNVSDQDKQKRNRSVDLFWFLNFQKSFDYVEIVYLRKQSVTRNMIYQEFGCVRIYKMCTVHLCWVPRYKKVVGLNREEINNMSWHNKHRETWLYCSQWHSLVTQWSLDLSTQSTHYRVARRARCERRGEISIYLCLHTSECSLI